MPVDCVKLARKFEALRAESAPARETWDELEKYVMPRVGGNVSSSGVDAGEASAIWKNPDRWDATAPNALRKLAAHIHGSATPAGTQWFSGAFPDRELNEDKASREWIEGNAKLLWQAIEESDFQGEAAAAFQDYVGIGNVFVVQEVDDQGAWKGLDYKAVSGRECEFEENSRGTLATWWRSYCWTGAQLVDKFGEQGVPQRVRDELAGEAPRTSPYDVCYCVWERPELKGQKPSALAVPALRPYGAVYFLRETGEQLGEEGGYYDCPVFLARWERTPGSRWAHGLGHVALPNVRFVNSWLEMMIGEGAAALAPVIYTTDDGIFGDVDRSPGKVVPVGSLDGFKESEHRGRHDVGQAVLEGERAQIRRIFAEDQLDLKDSPQMTAMEAQLRYDLMLKLLGPTLARLQSEFLDQMLLAAYRAMYRAGKFPKPPPKVLEKGEQFSFVYLGPTARARRADQVAALERGAAYVAALMKMGFTEVRHVFRPVESVREVFDALGITSKVLAGEPEVRKKQAAETELQGRMARAETARAEGEAVEQGAAARAAVAPTESFQAAPAPLLDAPLV